MFDCWTKSYFKAIVVTTTPGVDTLQQQEFLLNKIEETFKSVNAINSQA